MTAWVAWIAFFVYVVLISIGIGLCCKRAGIKKWKWACLPFISFFFLNRLTGGFKSLGVIRIDNWGKSTIGLVLLCALCHFMIRWGYSNLANEDAVALEQILILFIVLAAIIFYLGCIGFTKKIISVFKASFRFEGLVCALFITMPFILMVDLRKYSYEPYQNELEQKDLHEK